MYTEFCCLCQELVIFKYLFIFIIFMYIHKYVKILSCLIEFSPKDHSGSLAPTPRNILPETYLTPCYVTITISQKANHNPDFEHTKMHKLVCEFYVNAIIVYALLCVSLILYNIVFVKSIRNNPWIFTACCILF
jgi:hypothetical protein